MRPTSASDAVHEWDFMEEADDLFADPGFVAALEDAGMRERLLRDLIAQRKAMRLNQTAVAQLMQTTQSAVSELENSTDAHFSTLQRYARAVAARIKVTVDLPASCPWHPADQWASEVAPIQYMGRETHMQRAEEDPRPSLAGVSVDSWFALLSTIDPQPSSVALKSPALA